MKSTIVASHQDNVNGHEFTINFMAGEVASVQLLSHPSKPARTLAVVTKGYTGDYSNQLTDEEVPGFMHDLKSTKLGTPAEMLNFVFLIRDVPRSWTHQAVRTRIGAAVVQESTRFIGAKDEYKILVPKSLLSPSNVVNPDYLRTNIEAICSYEKCWQMVQ